MSTQGEQKTQSDGTSHADPTQRDPETLTVEQVRQGQTGTGLRYVLLISMIAVAIVLAITYFSFA